MPIYPHISGEGLCWCGPMMHEETISKFERVAIWEVITFTTIQRWTHWQEFSSRRRHGQPRKLNPAWAIPAKATMG